MSTNLIKGDENGTLDRIEREEHKVTRELILTTSFGLAQQNDELLSQVQLLRNQNQYQLDLLTEQENQLQMVLEELNEMKKERQRKADLKERRASRKRQPKRQPMTSDLYAFLLTLIPEKNYIAARSRIAFCLLTVTGVRIGELLPLRVYQMETLRKFHWIAITRSKRGPSNHKAFLTTEGKRIVSDREEDLRFLCMTKDPDSYLFTSLENPDQSLRCDSFTKSLNKVLNQLSNQLGDNPRITSHSFRSGYITKLWKDTKDIEFVRQSIGHAKLDTTSSYVHHLTDQERQQRMLEA